MKVGLESQFATQASLASQSPSPSPQELKTKQAFQDFVAGTFFKQMLKALRSTQGETHYMNGGQAEKSFRSQLDQQIAEDLARKNGAPFSEGLYKQFRIKHQAAMSAQSLNSTHFDELA